MSPDLIELQSRIAGSRPPRVMPERVLIRPRFTYEIIPRERVEQRPPPRERLRRVMADGRARTLDQLAEAADVRPDTTRKAMTAWTRRGDVEAVELAGLRLYSVTHFGG